MTPEEARRRALLALGGVEQTKERYRDRRGWPWLSHLGQDLRYGLRTLRKNPGFASVAVVTLSLGIGANTAIFTLLDALALRSLPVHRPEGLFYLQEQYRGQENSHLSYPAFERLRDRAATLSGLFATTRPGSGGRMNVVAEGRAEIATGELVTGEYFNVLGVVPHRGRLLNTLDDRHEGAAVVLSYAYWQRRFGGNPAVVGTSVAVNNVPLTIVGA